MGRKDRTKLTPYPLEAALGVLTGETKACVITMAEDQWDGSLSSAYHAGWILLEVNADDRPVRAYRKTEG